MFLDHTAPRLAIFSCLRDTACFRDVDNSIRRDAELSTVCCTSTVFEMTSPAIDTTHSKFFYALDTTMLLSPCGVHAASRYVSF